MLRRWWYYVSFVWRDLIRQPKATQIQSIVVAGICLPVLVLIMLKRGHVQELRRELIESPTGRQIKLYCSGGGEFFPRDGLLTFCQQLGPVDVVIPDNVVRGCTFSRTNGVKPANLIRGVDINATSPGDPILNQCGCDVLKNDEDGIIVSDSLAAEANLGVDDFVQITVLRFAANEQVHMTLPVRAIATGDSSRPTAFMNSQTLDRVKSWQKGEAFERWNWPSLVTTTAPRYRQFLLFTETDDPLTDRGRRELARRQLQVNPLPGNERAALDQLLDPETLDQINVYRITGPVIDGAASVLSVDPATLSDRTPADDVIIPWCSPQRLRIQSQETFVVGLSVPEFNWLRLRFRSDQVLFSTEENPLQISFHQPVDPDVESVALTTSSGSSVPLSLKGIASNRDDLDEPVTPEDGSRLAVVPVQLLAQLEALRDGHVTFDSRHRAFLPVPAPVSYEEVRLFANSIDDVPGIVERAAASGYGFQANSQRIEEIQRQSASLQVLVNVVGVAVFAFGMITVTVVLIESTHQKCGTIGILRVMGASQRGLFFFVCLRAALIGCLGGLCATTCAASFALVMGLSADDLAWLPSRVRDWKPDVLVVISATDFLLTVVVSTCCCVIGAFLPALRAIRIDPVEAVIEGRLK